MECLSAVGLLFHSWVYVKSVSCIENEFVSLVMRSKASAPDNLLWYELNSFHFGREFNCFFSQHPNNEGAGDKQVAFEHWNRPGKFPPATRRNNSRAWPTARGKR